MRRRRILFFSAEERAAPCGATRGGEGGVSPDGKRVRPAQAVVVNSTASLAKRRSRLLFGVVIHYDAPGAWPIHRSMPLRGRRNIVQLIFSGDCPGGVFLSLSVGRSASDMPPGVHRYAVEQSQCRAACGMAASPEASPCYLVSQLPELRVYPRRHRRRCTCFSVSTDNPGSPCAFGRRHLRSGTKSGRFVAAHRSA